MKATHKPKKGENFKGIRWLLVLFSIFGAFGFEYSFDIPSATKDLLQAYFVTKYSESEFEIFYSMLYSIMAFPNIVLPLVLDILIDKFGVRINFAFMAIGIALGNIMIYFGIKNLSFPLIFAGRIFTGATGESIHIVEGLFLREYFSSNRMSFIIAAIECFLHLGGVVNSWVSPRLAVGNVGAAFEAAVFICAFNSVLICIACGIDKYVEKKNQEIENNKSNPNLFEEYEDEDDPFLNLELPEEPQGITELSTWQKIINYFSKIAHFPSIYWFLTIAGAISLPSILSFTMISTSYITDKQNSQLGVGEATVLSAQVASLVRIAAAFSSPFLGFTIDRIGNRANFLCAGVLTALLSHILIIFINPLLCCVLFGISYALIATTLWPSIYVIIDKSMLGIATGIVNAIDNTGLFIFPLIVSLIKNAAGSYDYSQIFLACLTGVATLGSFKVIYMLKQRHKKPHIPRLSPQFMSPDENSSPNLIQ